MDKQKKIYTFESFVILANLFFKSIGVYAYDDLKGGKKKSFFWEIFVFYANLANTIIMMIAGCVVIQKSLFNNENFLEMTMMMAYMITDLVAIIKLLNIVRNKAKLTHFMRDLYSIFPSTLEAQRQYELRRYWQQSKRVTRGFSVMFLVLIWIYNLSTFISWLIHGVWLKTPGAEQLLPYDVWTPFDWHGNWKYYLMVILLSLQGHGITAYIISTDLLLFSIATQMIMHYEHIVRSLENYEVQAKEVAPFDDVLQVQSTRKDLKIIGEIVEYHGKILRLSDGINDIFGISLLTNFFLVSLLLCIVGFQLTISHADSLTKIQLSIYLSSWLVQVYLISYFGQKLMDSSTRVGQAAYNQIWYNADTRFKKMLIPIIARAQKPAILRATNFLDVSMISFGDMIQRSYQFFAILRQMYEE